MVEFRKFQRHQKTDITTASKVLRWPSLKLWSESDHKKRSETVRCSGKWTSHQIAILLQISICSLHPIKIWSIVSTDIWHIGHKIDYTSNSQYHNLSLVGMLSIKTYLFVCFYYFSPLVFYIFSCSLQKVVKIMICACYYSLFKINEFAERILNHVGKKICEW